MRYTLTASLAFLALSLFPLTPVAARESGCVTLDCKQVTAGVVRREMSYRTHHAAVAKVLIAMYDETHIKLSTNFLFGDGAKPVSVILDNTDARSIADALYNLFSFGYQKDKPEITDTEMRALVARKTVYIERQDFHNALEFFSFADLSNVQIFDAPRR